MIEEAYELVDAIERADADGIEEETGDVLMQAAFHSVLQSERGCFTGGDALTRVVKKLIFRHSHIFGGDKAASESEALGVWENNKKIEKGMSSFSQTVLAVPKNFPSCMYAQKVQKRASKSGMDFTCPEEAAKKLAEEVEELLCALKQSDGAAVCDEAGGRAVFGSQRLQAFGRRQRKRASRFGVEVCIKVCRVRKVNCSGRQRDDKLDLFRAR